MICYQDEKMHGPPADGKTLEELLAEIEKLEVEIYGHTISDEVERISMPQDVKRD